VAPGVRRGIRSAVNRTLGGQRDRRFRAQWPPERPFWRLRPSFGAGGRPPTSLKRPTKHLARHTPATSKKQMPIGWPQPTPSVQSIVYPPKRNPPKGSFFWLDSSGLRVVFSRPWQPR
jgi:hypothetical protein